MVQKFNFNMKIRFNAQECKDGYVEWLGLLEGSDGDKGARETTSGGVKLSSNKALQRSASYILVQVYKDGCMCSPVGGRLGLSEGSDGDRGC